MKHQIQSLFLWKIGETSAEEQTHSKDPSAQTRDTNINLIRFAIVKNGDSWKFRPRYHLNIVHEPSQQYARMSNTEPMYTKTCNRCSAMMNKHSHFNSL